MNPLQVVDIKLRYHKLFDGWGLGTGGNNLETCFIAATQS